MSRHPIPMPSTPPDLSNLPFPMIPFGSTMPAMFSMEEVRRHSTVEDCWMIIDGKVIDVSSFIRSHPGGVSSMMPYAGQDATTRFTSLHGPAAARKLSPLIMGGVRMQAMF